MKYIIHIVFACVIGLHAQAQDTLPSNNELIIQWVDEHYGEKIRSGICEEIMYESWSYVNEVRGFRDSVMDEIDFKDIIPGDMIIFEKVQFLDGTYIDKHMGIIKRVMTNGLIMIVEQNSGSMDDGSQIMYKGEMAPLVKDSRMLFNTFDLNKVISGSFSFYRI